VPQPSVALKTHLELTKTELANVVFLTPADNLSDEERQANKDLNLIKANKGTTTVIYDTIT
jgi:hypothetical protein